MATIIMRATHEIHCDLFNPGALVSSAIDVNIVVFTRNLLLTALGIQSSTALIDQGPNDGCFRCWPGSHRYHVSLMAGKYRGAKVRENALLSSGDFIDYLFLFFSIHMADLT